MKTFEFTIVATGLDPTAHNFESRFYDAGCDDSLVSFQKGHVLIDFAREAESFRDALISALENVRSAGATIQRVEPDPLVNLADMATRAGMSRAAMSNYAAGVRGENFPAPVVRVTTSSPLWNWADVAQWLASKGHVDTEEAENAEILEDVNEKLLESA